jgi:hypothetical protein
VSHRFDPLSLLVLLAASELADVASLPDEDDVSTIPRPIARGIGVGASS